MAGMEQVEIEEVNVDRYGRLIAFVYIEDSGMCLNEELNRERPRLGLQEVF